MTELMVVLGLVALFLAAAMPLLSYLSGSRDLDAAQNVISSFLARAHEEAMAQQDGRGVAFYRDPVSDRIAMAMVYYDDPLGQPTQVDLSPDSEQVLLPRGVGTAFVEPKPTATGSRYSFVGLIMFDGRGQVAVTRCHIRGDGALGQVLASEWNGTSQPALMLFDQRAMDDQQDKNQYIDDSGWMMLVNRYHGTLSRAE